ncbi:MAG: hypothetical protein M3305_00025 [Actinomycetota bacterium]|nr:hypothetical protein [Actinomycetota bacterium]
MPLRRYSRCLRAVFPQLLDLPQHTGNILRILLREAGVTRAGLGRAMLAYLSKLAKDRDFGRLEWSVMG